MYIADHLSRSPLPSDCTSQDSADPVYAELEAVNQANFLNVTPTRYEQIQSATDKDAALQAVIQVVLKGWPAQRDNVAPAAREYWPFRDEMSIQDVVLYQGCRVVIPSLLRQEMLGRIHYAHLGVEACLRRARETLYWPGMTGEIKDLVAGCPACNEFRPTQANEPLMTHEVPTRPWRQDWNRHVHSRVGGLFDHGGLLFRLLGSRSPVNHYR